MENSIGLFLLALVLLYVNHAFTLRPPEAELLESLELFGKAIATKSDEEMRLQADAVTNLAESTFTSIYNNGIAAALATVSAKDLSEVGSLAAIRQALNVTGIISNAALALLQSRQGIAEAFANTYGLRFHSQNDTHKDFAKRFAGYVSCFVRDKFYRAIQGPADNLKEACERNVQLLADLNKLGPLRHIGESSNEQIRKKFGEAWMTVASVQMALVTFVHLPACAWFKPAAFANASRNATSHFRSSLVCFRLASPLYQKDEEYHNVPALANANTSSPCRINWFYSDDIGYDVVQLAKNISSSPSDRQFFEFMNTKNMLYAIWLAMGDATSFVESLGDAADASPAIPNVVDPCSNTLRSAAGVVKAADTAAKTAQTVRLLLQQIPTLLRNTSIEIATKQRAFVDATDGASRKTAGPVLADYLHAKFDQVANVVENVIKEMETARTFFAFAPLRGLGRHHKLKIAQSWQSFTRFATCMNQTLGKIKQTDLQRVRNITSGASDLGDSYLAEQVFYIQEYMANFSAIHDRFNVSETFILKQIAALFKEEEKGWGSWTKAQERQLATTTQRLQVLNDLLESTNYFLEVIVVNRAQEILTRHAADIAGRFNATLPTYVFHNSVGE